MLDSIVRPYITPSLSKIAEKIESFGIHANILTIGGLLGGLIGCFFVAIQSYFFGLVLILISRLIHGLGSAVASRTGETAFGALLSSVCKTVFYASFIFFFVLTLPSHMMAGLFLLFSAIVLKSCAANYKAAMMHRADDAAITAPSFVAGLVDNTLVLLFIILVCLFPGVFSGVSFLLGILCWICSFSYIMQSWYIFGQSTPRSAVPHQDDLTA